MSTGSNNGEITSLWLVRIGATIIVMIVWFWKPTLKLLKWELWDEEQITQPKVYTTFEYQIVIDEKARVVAFAAFQQWNIRWEKIEKKSYL